MKRAFLFPYIFFVCLAEALIYMYNVMVWRLSKKGCIGRLVYYKGRQHPVIGETYHHFYIEDTGTSFLKDDYYSNDNYLINRNQCNGNMSYQRF